VSKAEAVAVRRAVLMAGSPSARHLTAVLEETALEIVTEEEALCTQALRKQAHKVP
jgi:hypothetical protein